MRFWGGRFDEENDARVADFTRSIESTASWPLDDIAGSIAHVRGLGRAGLLTADEVDALVAGLGRCGRTSRRARSPGTRRSRTCTSTSRRRSPTRVGAVGRQAPHRPVAQRPGRDGPAAVAAPGRRPARRGDSSASSARSSASPSGRATRSCRARPTSSRPSPCCSPTTCWPTSRCSSATAAGSPTRAAGPTSRRSAPARWRAPAIRSTARRRPRSSASTTSPPTRSTPSATATSSSSLAAAALAMVHLSRLAEEITWWSNPRFGSSGPATLLDRLVDDAQQEEPGSGRARPRPSGRVIGALTADARRCSRACRSRTSATSRRTSPPLFEAVGELDASLRSCRALDTLPSTAERMRARPRRATRRRRPSPTRSFAAASRSVSPTTSSDRCRAGRGDRPAASTRCPTG